MTTMTETLQASPTLSDFVAEWAKKTPDATALVHDTVRLSYTDLDQAVKACAKALLASGIKSGDRVATLSAPNPNYLITFLATLSVGGIWVGLNPRYQIEELLYVIGDAEPSLIFAHTHLGERDYSSEISRIESEIEGTDIVLFDGDPGTLTYKAFLQRESDEQIRFDPSEIIPGDDPALIVYTSGSTGKPKGAVLTSSAIANYAADQLKNRPINPFRILNFLPINHIGCVVDISAPCLAAGGTMVLMEQFDPARALQLMQDEAVTVWGSVPTTFLMQLALPDFDTYDLSAVDMIMWQGAAMPQHAIAKLSEVSENLMTGYGMTESTSLITLSEAGESQDSLASSVGKPFPGVDVRLWHDSGRQAKVEEPGEIQIRSPYLFHSYWNRPEATAEAFTQDGWFKTGDIGQIGDDGRYKIVGRIKEMFKSGGYNVYPREIETVLEAHPGISAAVVIGIPDPKWQEIGVAYVIANRAINTDELTRFCKGQLANYKVPKHIVIVDGLPILPVGKVDKVTLRKQAIASFADEMDQL